MSIDVGDVRNLPIRAEVIAAVIEAQAMLDRLDQRLDQLDQRLDQLDVREEALLSLLSGRELTEESNKGGHQR